LHGYHAEIGRGRLALDELTAAFPPPPTYFETLRTEESLREVRDSRLQHVLELAAQTPFYQRLWQLHGIDYRDVRNVEDLTHLPTFDVDDIRESIERRPPYGEHHRISEAGLAERAYRVYFSGGTTGVPRPALYSVWDREVGSIMMARTLWMQGIRPGDAVLVAWSFGTHQGAWIYDEALYKWLGALVIATSTGNVTPSEKQIETARRYSAASIFATSDYLVHLAAVAKKLGYDPKSDFMFKSFPTIMDTKAVERAWGRPAYNCWGTYELQTVTAECTSQQGMHVFEDGYVVQVQDVETGTEVADGEWGNLIVTNLYAETFPMIRYNTRDVSRITSRALCSCGLNSARIDDIYGRSDTMVKLRGINVWPEAIGRVATTTPGATGEYFCELTEVDGREELTLLVEVAGRKGDESLAADLRRLIKHELEVSVSVVVCDIDELAASTGRGVSSKPKRFSDLRTRRKGRMGE
jgi:phenylacetate-CoA ligase